MKFECFVYSFFTNFVNSGTGYLRGNRIRVKTVNELIFFFNVIVRYINYLVFLSVIIKFRLGIFTNSVIYYHAYQYNHTLCHMYHA